MIIMLALIVQISVTLQVVEQRFAQILHLASF